MATYIDKKEATEYQIGKAFLEQFNEALGKLTPEKKKEVLDKVVAKYLERKHKKESEQMGA